MSEVSYDEDQSIISWNYDGCKRSLKLKSVSQYALDERAGHIFALSVAGSVPEDLYLVDAKDGRYRSLRRPPGFVFYYLTSHPQLGVSIVCVSEELVEGWRDWHFSYDPVSNKLVRAIPAY